LAAALLKGAYLKNVSNFLIGFKLDYVIQLVMRIVLKKSHTYSNKKYCVSFVDLDKLQAKLRAMRA
jgi:hypothetical protein